MTIKKVLYSGTHHCYKDYQSIFDLLELLLWLNNLTNHEFPECQQF